MDQNHMLARPASRTVFAATASPMGHDQKHILHNHNQHQHQHQQQERRQTPPCDLKAVFQSFDRPFKLPLYPPPSYAQTHHDHNHSHLVFPDAPKTELAPIQSLTGAHNDQKKIDTLPSLSTLTAAASTPLYSSSSTHHQRPTAPTFTPHTPPAPIQPAPTHWPSLNPLTAYYTPSHVQSAEPPLRMDLDSITNTSAPSATSPEPFDQGRAPSVSLDDPDVRLAAEALGDLRADFVSSPPNKHTPLPETPRSQSNVPPEPLLQLLTTNHPLLGNVIEGTQSAYVASKNYSPRFKSGAEYVEGYVTPIANTVGSVGRVTGMEGGVRWFLGGGKRHKPHNSADLEAGDRYGKLLAMEDGSSVFSDSDEPMSGAETPRPTYDPHDRRRLSVASTVDTLPAYDEFRSPAYTESSEARGIPTAWQSRLIMSTSGLSIAMSEESLRSLKYCLSWLRWANVHIGNVINSLKSAMERYEKPITADADGDQVMAGMSDDGDKREIAAKITTLRADILKTLQDVINTVSRYAGGALPENARLLVRRHLTSLPQRFHLANMVGAPSQRRDGTEETIEAKEKEMRESTQRVLVLAKEGLDMMAQVSGVLDGTIVSAEEWCERLGRKKREQREALVESAQPQRQSMDNDVKMG